MDENTPIATTPSETAAGMPLQSAPPASNNVLQQKAAEQLSKAATFVFGSGSMSAKAEKNLCILIHLAGCLFWFVPPLILWMWKRDVSETVDANGKEAVNFQLTFFVITIALGVVSFGILGLVAYISSILLAVIAAANVSQGKQYRYPFTYRAIK